MASAEYIHGCGQRCDCLLLPSPVTAHKYRTTYCFSLWAGILVPQSRVLGQWIVELHEKRKKVLEAPGDCTERMEDGRSKSIEASEHHGGPMGR